MLSDALAAQRRVEEARGVYEDAIAARNAAVREAHDDKGATIYAIAKALGVTQGAVRNMLGL